MPLSEKLFFLFIAGTLLAVLGSLSLQDETVPVAVRSIETLHPTESVPVAQIYGGAGSGQAAGGSGRSGSGAQGGSDASQSLPDEILDELDAIRARVRARAADDPDTGPEVEAVMVSRIAQLESQLAAAEEYAAAVAAPAGGVAPPASPPVAAAPAAEDAPPPLTRAAGISPEEAAQARSEEARALFSDPGLLISGVEGRRDRSPGAPAVPASAPTNPGVFVPSKLGMAFNVAAQDVWHDWEDVNEKNITGYAGVQALNDAFDVVAKSRARSITDDLVRKGVPVLFGDVTDFTGEMENTIAFFDFESSFVESDDPDAPQVPRQTPQIKFNPLFMNAEPELLAAGLVHEATHFQQFLDGSLTGATHADIVDLEFQAWWNEAAFWDEARATTWPINTFLEEQAELAYRTALRGEAALKDLLAAIHG